MIRHLEFLNTISKINSLYLTQIDNVTKRTKGEKKCVIQRGALWFFVCVSIVKCYLQHCKPGTLQRFVGIHLHISRLGEHLKLRQLGTGCESTLEERRIQGLRTTSFFPKSKLLLRSVWVDFDCLTGLELLQVYTPVACLTCTPAIKYTVKKTQPLFINKSKVLL